MEGVFNHSLEFGNGHLLCSNTCLWDAGTVPLEPEVTFTIWSSLFLSWTISDHFQVVLVGRFTVGVRASRHWAVRSTLDHWLGRKREGEANVEEDEEDEREEFLAKLVVILFVRELVGVFHESIGDCGQEGGGSCGSPQIVQGRVALILENWSTQADCYQQKLQGCIHLADSGGLDGGSG